MAYIVLSFLFILLSSVSACENCVYRSKATYTGSQFTSGSCGYGALALSFNKLLAAGGPAIFNDGAGCGACFKIRCKNPGLCKRDGTKVMVVDSHGDTNRDFVLSKKALQAMAKPGMSQDLVKLGEVDIEFKRVSCDFDNRNLAIRVEEASNKPYYLAVKILYQGGETEIMTVDVAPVNSRRWNPMRRSYGAVWDSQKMLSGPLKFRFLVRAGFKSVYHETKTVLPSNWKNGVIYDAGFQIHEITQDLCDNCQYTNW